MRASDILRLRKMEREANDCWVDRYYGDYTKFAADNPDVSEMCEKMSSYLKTRQINIEIPTYFHYWEDEDFRRILWLLERDPIASGIQTRISRLVRQIIDGTERRLKRVGDGSHAPIGDGAAN